jgi:hypothetical protein
MAKQSSESTQQREQPNAQPKQSVETPRGAPPPEEQPNPGDPGPPVLRPDR